MKQYQIIEISNSSRMTVIDLDSKLLQEGIIEINDVFTADSVSTWRNALLYLKSKMSPEDTQQHPIQLHINSPGGDAYSMFGLLATIQSMQKVGYIISTINVGLAASAACWILMAGSKGYRKSLKYCTTMIHTVSSVSYGKIADMITDVNESKRIQEELNKLTSELSDKELIDKFQYLDFWMNPDDAKKYNIIDEII